MPIWSMRLATVKSAVWRSSEMVFFCAVPSATHMTDDTATSTSSAKPKTRTTAIVGRQRPRCCGVACVAVAAVRVSSLIAGPAPRSFSHDLHPLPGSQCGCLREAVQHQEVLQVVVTEGHTRGDLGRCVAGFHLVDAHTPGLQRRGLGIAQLAEAIG